MSEPIPIRRFTNEALETLRKLSEIRPELWRNPDTSFLWELGQLGLRDNEEPTGLTALDEIQVPPSVTGRLQDTDQSALAFRDNIPGLEAQHLSDPNLLAWLSCQHLLEYGIARWPLRGKQEPARWALQHFLSADARDMSNSSVAGRLLWLSEISRRASAASGFHTPQEVLEHYTRNTETYHIQQEFQVLRYPRVMSSYTQAILEDALGAKSAGIREIARDLNRAAGARLLDAVSHRTLRTITEQSVDRVMHTPDLVNDRTKLRGGPALRILSLGAGAQSSCLALMADQGYEGLEKPDCAIFADTGWEPPAVYEHLAWLENELTFPVYRVRDGNIRDDILAGRTPTGRNFISIPVHTVDEAGKPGIGKRQCTSEYKLKPIFRKVRELLGVPPGKRSRKEQWAEIWIGITTDEAERAKPSREEYLRNRHPFLEMGISRRQLIDWFQRNHPGRELPRSACIGCPYRTDVEWKHLRDQDPASFEDAANVDWALRNMPDLKAISRVEMFLNSRRIPLREVDLENTPTQAELHRQECEGMCWI